MDSDPQINPIRLLFNFFYNAVVAGFGTENQILEALRRYLNRPQYVTKTLYYLFKMTTGNYEPRIDMNHPRTDIISVSLIFFIYMVLIRVVDPD
jgi:hypothetical protein